MLRIPLLRIILLSGHGLVLGEVSRELTEFVYVSSFRIFYQELLDDAYPLKACGHTRRATPTLEGTREVANLRWRPIFPYRHQLRELINTSRIETPRQPFLLYPRPLHSITTFHDFVTL